MEYTEEIEQKILAQIEATPDAAVILPAWCYWAGEDQPVIYVDRMPVRLIRYLYELLIGPLDPEAGLVVNPGIDRRNVNPHLATVTARRGVRLQCPNGHEYTEADELPDGSHKCRACYEAKLVGEPSPPAKNREKTHCPKNHEYTPENLVNLKSGRRRCKTCHRETQAAHAARKANV